jgi:hypothetical protein
MTEREQYGRWTGAEGVTFSHGDGPAAELAIAFALHALNEVSKGVTPAPGVGLVLPKLRRSDM